MNVAGGTIISRKKQNVGSGWGTAGTSEEYTVENPFTKERLTRKMASALFPGIICSLFHVTESMVKIEEKVEGSNTVHVICPGVIRANISVDSCGNGLFLYRKKLFYKSRPPYTWFTVADVMRVIETQIPRGMIKSLYYEGEPLLDMNKYLCSLPYNKPRQIYNGLPILTLDFTLCLKQAIFYATSSRIISEEYDSSMKIRDVRAYFAKMYPQTPIKLIDVALNGQIIDPDNDDKTVSEIGYTLGDLFSCELRRDPETIFTVNFKRVDDVRENPDIKLNYQFTIIDKVAVARKNVAQALCASPQSVCLFYAGKKLDDNLIISRLAVKDPDFIGVYVKARDIVPLMSEDRIRIFYDIKFQNTKGGDVLVLPCDVMTTCNDIKRKILEPEGHPQYHISMQFNDQELPDEAYVLDITDEDSTPILFTVTEPDNTLKKVKSLRHLLEKEISLEELKAHEEDEEDEEAILAREEKLYAQIPWQELIVLRKHIPEVDEIEAIEKYIELGKNLKAVISFFKARRSQNVK